MLIENKGNSLVDFGAKKCKVRELVIRRVQNGKKGNLPTKENKTIE